MITGGTTAQFAQSGGRLNWGEADSAESQTAMTFNKQKESQKQSKQHNSASTGITDWDAYYVLGTRVSNTCETRLLPLRICCLVGKTRVKLWQMLLERNPQKGMKRHGSMNAVCVFGEQGSIWWSWMKLGRACVGLAGNETLGVGLIHWKTLTVPAKAVDCPLQQQKLWAV